MLQWHANLVVLLGIANSEDVVRRRLSSWKLSLHVEIHENLSFLYVRRPSGRASLENSSINRLKCPTKPKEWRSSGTVSLNLWHRSLTGLLIFLLQIPHDRKIRLTQTKFKLLGLLIGLFLDYTLQKGSFMFLMLLFYFRIAENIITLKTMTIMLI